MNISEEKRTFEFSFDINRFSHCFENTLEWTEAGWTLDANVHSGKCKKDGKPFVYRNFEQDDICWPSSFGKRLSHLHRETPDMTDEEVQTAIDELLKWIKLINDSQPKVKPFDL